MAWGLRNISGRELAEWRAFYEIEPFGAEREDLRAGIVASTVANTARNPKRRRRPYRPREFMPNFRPPMDWQEQLAFVQALNNALGGRDLRNNR